MAVVWPPTLPQAPLLDGFEVQDGNQVIRSQIDAGPEKVRQRFTAAVDPITCRYGPLTRAQKQTLSGFYKNVASAIAFDWPDWSLDPPGQVVRARFRDPPRYTPVTPDIWFASVSLQRLPTPFAVPTAAAAEDTHAAG
jgi:hypothetical protein